LSTVNKSLGKAKTGYGVVKSANEFFNSGTPGNPLKAMGVIIGLDSIASGPLTQAGVGPQAAFITKFAETATDFTMGKHDEATAALKSGFAKQHLEMHRMTGDPKHLLRAVEAARPSLTYGHLKSWDTTRPLVVKPHAGMPGQRPHTAVGNLAKGWKTTVTKEPFRTNATNPLGRAGDWANWKLNPNNIRINSSYDRTFHNRDGTTRIQIHKSKTGYGYQPGQTKRTEYSRYEFRGNRVQRVGGGATNYRYNNTNTRSSFSRPSTSRSSFSRPTISRPSTSFR